ncbi:MAG: branched-chain amino acid aminotransferase [Bacteroidetes bacterium]|nr:branched-chain amino acid aminotransferase [Bacteroidota bacterium]
MITTAIPITVKKTAKSRIAELDEINLGFGKIFSDHMFVAEYSNGQWKEASIMPYDKIPFSPSSSMMHYGQSIFEGMKAYRAEDGRVLLFRPLANQKRLNISAVRMAMPTIPEELFMDGLLQLIKMDSSWVPKGDGASLYIRPFLIATDDYIGVKPSETYKFLIITSPVGKYYNEPVKVLVETNYIRAVEGGVGFVKASGNYGRSLYPTRLAQQKGYQQVIWTDARHHRYLEESGTMNVMFVLDDVLVTPPLGDTILAGITRDSVLAIARDWGMKVEERKISVDEIIDAHKNNTLKEAFGTGTAATIAPICLIGYEGVDYPLPALTDASFSRRVGKELDDIRKGRISDRHSWTLAV